MVDQYPTIEPAEKLYIAIYTQIAVVINEDDLNSGLVRSFLDWCLESGVHAELRFVGPYSVKLYIFPEDKAKVREWLVDHAKYAADEVIVK